MRSQVLTEAVESTADVEIPTVDGVHYRRRERGKRCIQWGIVPLRQSFDKLLLKDRVGQKQQQLSSEIIYLAGPCSRKHSGFSVSRRYDDHFTLRSHMGRAVDLFQKSASFKFLPIRENGDGHDRIGQGIA